VRAKPNEYGELNMGEVERIINCTELLFTYALIWSIGGNMDEESRSIFNKIIHEI